MKKKVIQICSLVALVVGLMVSAQAQIGTQYRAHIPFDFNVGNQTLPAGDYTISLTNPMRFVDVLTIRDTKSGKAQIVTLLASSSSDRSQLSKLTFNRYDDQYFLAEVNSPTVRGKFRRAKTEARLAKLLKPGQENVAMSK